MAANALAPVSLGHQQACYWLIPLYCNDTKANVYTLRLRQKDYYFPNNIIKCNFLNENV